MTDSEDACTNSKSVQEHAEDSFQDKPVTRRAFVALASVSAVAAVAVQASVLASPQTRFQDASLSINAGARDAKDSAASSDQGTQGAIDSAAQDAARSADSAAHASSEQPDASEQPGAISDVDRIDNSIAAGEGTGIAYDKYPVFQGLPDAYGFRVITGQAAGCQLEAGLAYRVTGNVRLKPALSGAYRAGLVANSNLIYIDAGATLSIEGASGSFEKPGLPGVALRDGTSLFVAGKGTFEAKGGDAGSAYFGGSAENPRESGDWMYSGAGGKGSDGGGGAGAGIGTAGSYGGKGGQGGAETSARSDTRDARDVSGNNGTDGQSAACPSLPGQLCIGETVHVSGIGGQESRATSSAGSGGSWKKINQNAFTKHLTGGSAGGGSGGPGGAGDGFGTGGIGGGGGGGGGSAGCIWLARWAGSSDDPPTGDGGNPGYGGNLTTWRHGDKGDGRRRTRGTHDHCGGGWGGKGAAGQTGSNTPQFVGASFVTVLATGGKDIWQRVSIPRWDTTKNASARVVSSYAGFADVKWNTGWFIQNKRANLDGKGASWSSFATIAGVTTVSEVKDLLTKNEYLPTRQDATFAGWALDGDSSKMVCTVGDAGITFNVDVLKANNKVVMENATDGVWMCPAVTTFTAVWKENAYSIIFHTNRGTFVDAKGQPTTRENITLAGFQKGKAVRLPDRGKVGNYMLKPPADMPLSSPLIGWTKKVDEEGYPAPGYSVYVPNYDIASLNPKNEDPVHLYAVWKTDENPIFVKE